MKSLYSQEILSRLNFIYNKSYSHVVMKYSSMEVQCVRRYRLHGNYLCNKDTYTFFDPTIQ